MGRCSLGMDYGLSVGHTVRIPEVNLMDWTTVTDRQEVMNHKTKAGMIANINLYHTVHTAMKIIQCWSVFGSAPRMHCTITSNFRVTPRTTVYCSADIFGLGK